MPMSIPVTVIEDAKTDSVRVSQTLHGFEARVSPTIVAQTVRKSGDWGHELQTMILQAIRRAYPTQVGSATVHLI